MAMFEGTDCKAIYGDRPTNPIELIFMDPLPQNTKCFEQGKSYLNIYGATSKIPTRKGNTLQINLNKFRDENWEIFSIETNKQELTLNYCWSEMDAYYSVDNLLSCEILPLQVTIESFLKGEGISKYKTQVTVMVVNS